MSAPVTIAFDLENPHHRDALRLLAQHFEGHQETQSSEPTRVAHQPKPARPAGHGSRPQKVKAPSQSELPPDNVRPIMAAQVDEMATRKGAVKP